MSSVWFCLHSFQLILWELCPSLKLNGSSWKFYHRCTFGQGRLPLNFRSHPDSPDPDRIHRGRGLLFLSALLKCRGLILTVCVYVCVHCNQVTRVRVWRRCFRWSVRVTWYWWTDGRLSSVRRSRRSTPTSRRASSWDAQIQCRATSSITISQSASMLPLRIGFMWCEKNTRRSLTAGRCWIVTFRALDTTSVISVVGFCLY